MIVPTETDLDLRGMDTLLASWAAYAQGASGASLLRAPALCNTTASHGTNRHEHDESTSA